MNVTLPSSRRAARRAVGLRHATPDIIGLQHFQVRLQFFIQAARAPAAEEAAETRRPHAHRAHSALSSSRVTVATVRCQLASSVRSCCRPGRVME